MASGGCCRLPPDTGLGQLSDTDSSGLLRVLDHHAGIILEAGGAYASMVRRCGPKATLIGRAARAAASRSTGASFLAGVSRSEHRVAPPRAAHVPGTPASSSAAPCLEGGAGRGSSRSGQPRRPPRADDSLTDAAALASGIAAVEASLAHRQARGTIEAWEMPVRSPRRSARTVESVLNDGAKWARCEGCGSERAARLADWDVGRAMAEGTIYVTQFRRLERWVAGLAPAERSAPPAEGLANHLHRQLLPCAVGSSSNHYWLVRRVHGVLWWRPMDADEVAATLDVPAGHPVRRSIAAAAPGLGRELYGISVNVSSAEAVIRRGMEGSAPPQSGPTVGVACAGAGVICAAVDAALGGRRAWRYAFYVEREPRHAAVHDAAYLPRRPRHFVHADAAEEILRMPYVHLWLCSPNCQPFTSDNQSRSTADIPAAIAEFKGTMRYVRLRRPAVAIVEEVASVTHSSVRGEAGVLQQFERAIKDVPGYRWLRVVECPTEHAQAMGRRRRVWWVGQRRG